VVF
jgi:hypothetical protein